MKRFFKKLSFVLAAAMVVTMVPAQVTKAADLQTAYLVKQDAKDTSVKENVVFVTAGDTTLDFKFIGIKDYATTGKGWTSSNTAVATVDKKGAVTTKKAGTTDITYTATGYEGATCKVVVLPETIGEKLTIVEQETGEAVTSLEIGQTVDLKFLNSTTWKNAKKKIAVYSSSDETVLKTDDVLAGQFTALKAGRSTVTLLVETDGTVETAKLDVVVNVPKATVTFAQESINTAIATFSSETTVSKDEFTSQVAYSATSGKLTNLVKDCTQLKDAMGNKTNQYRLTFYNIFVEGNTYYLSYQNGAVTEFTGHVGTPTTLTLTYKSSDGVYGAAYPQEDATLVPTIKDQYGIDVTAKYQSAVQYSTESADAFIQDGKIWFFEAGKDAIVTAKVSQNKNDDEGNELFFDTTEISTVISSKDRPAFSLAKITGVTVNGNLSKATTQIKLDEHPDLLVKFLAADGKEYTSTTINNNQATYGKVTIKSADTDYYDVNGLTIYPYKKGNASVVVIWEAPNSENTLYFNTSVSIVDAPKASTVTADKLTVNLQATGNAEVGTTVDRDVVTFTVKDQYGNAVDMSSKTATVKLISANGDVVTAVPAANGNSDGQVTVTFNADTSDLTSRAKASAKYEVTIESIKNTIAVNTTFAKPGSVASKQTVATGNTVVDANASNQLMVGYYGTVNGVIATTMTLTKYADSLVVTSHSTANTGEYLVSMTKDGKAATNFATNAAGYIVVDMYSLGTAAGISYDGTITPADSTLTAGSGTAASKQIITSNAGSYQVTVSEVVTNSANTVATTHSVAGGTLKFVVADKLVAAKATMTKSVSDKSGVAAIVADCFKIDVATSNGAKATNAYYVVEAESRAAGTVYIKKITVYSEFASNRVIRTVLDIGKTITLE